MQEQILLILALIGGAVGSVAGQHIARHKTRKQPFGIYLKSIIILQFVLLVTLSFPSGREFLLSILLKVVE